MQINDVYAHARKSYLRDILQGDCVKRIIYDQYEPERRVLRSTVRNQPGLWLDSIPWAVPLRIRSFKDRNCDAHSLLGLCAHCGGAHISAQKITFDCRNEDPLHRARLCTRCEVIPLYKAMLEKRPPRIRSWKEWDAEEIRLEEKARAEAKAVKDAKRARIEASWLVKQIELPASDDGEFVSCDPDGCDGFHWTCSNIKDTFVGLYNAPWLRNNLAAKAVYEDRARQYVLKDVHDFERDDFAALQACYVEIRDLADRATILR